MKIYIVRHGETLANIEGRLQGTTDTPLSKKGIDLAYKTGLGLKDVLFDACYTSPLKRASDTAKIILENNEHPQVKIFKDERLKEINMGTWEGQKIKGEDSLLDKDKVQVFFSNPLLLDPFENGESTKEVIVRTTDFLNDLVSNYDYENVLITTHGFALRALLNSLYENKNDFWQGHVPYNCAVNIIEYQNGKFSFIAKDKIYYAQDDVVDRYNVK